MRLDDLPPVIRAGLRFVLHDEVRIFEVFSALNLLAWSWALWLYPGILARPSYEAFQAAPSGLWACIALFSGMLQVLAMILRHRHVARLRFPAMAIAAGVWTVIAMHFWAGPFSTSTINYTLIAIGCAVSGVFLGWKPYSKTS